MGWTCRGRVSVMTPIRRSVLRALVMEAELGWLWHMEICGKTQRFNCHDQLHWLVYRGYADVDTTRNRWAWRATNRGRAALNLTKAS